MVPVDRREPADLSGPPVLTQIEVPEVEATLPREAAVPEKRSDKPSQPARSIEEVMAEASLHRLRLGCTLLLAALCIAIERWAAAAAWTPWVGLALAGLGLALSGEVIHQSLLLNRARVHGDSLAALGGLSAFFAGAAAATLLALGRLSGRALSAAPAPAGEALSLGLETALLLLALPHLGRYLEARARATAARAIRGLRDLRPTRATVMTGTGEKEVSVESVRDGIDVLVLPRARLPVDGALVSGPQEVDEGIFGSRDPILKAPGDSLFAGTRNGNEPLVLRATGPGDDCTWHRALGLAQASLDGGRPRLALSLGAGSLLAGAGVSLASLLFAALWAAGYGYGPALRAALVVLILAWPGTLVLAGQVPAQVALAAAAGAGVILRSLSVLGRLANARVVFFGKTGILTRGRPRVAEVVPVQSRVQPEDLLFLATTLSIRSEHPIAEGILRTGGGRRQTIPVLRAFRALPGKGLRAQYQGKELCFGNGALLAETGVDAASADTAHRTLAERGLTPLFLAHGGEVLGLVGMSDEERPGASEAVAELKRMGVRCILLTGDCRAAADALARSLGLDEARAELDWNGKIEALKHCARSGHVLAVGNGVADASILAAADVGVALSAGGDLALDSAQALVLGSDPRAVSRLLSIARRAALVSCSTLAAAAVCQASSIALFAARAAGGHPPGPRWGALGLCVITAWAGALGWWLPRRLARLPGAASGGAGAPSAPVVQPRSKSLSPR